MKQTTKFLHILMCMVLGLSVSMTSCKDYDDDIDGLNQRVDALEGTLSQLSKDFEALTFVQSVTYDDANRKLTVVDQAGQSHDYVITDEVGEDTNTTYELSVLPEQASNGGRVIITLTGSDGSKSQVMFTLPTIQEFDPKSFEVIDGWLCYNGDQVVEMPQAAESFDPNALKLNKEDGYVYYGDTKTGLQLNSFNPALLKVDENGNLMYAGEVIEGVTIPKVKSDLAIVEIKDGEVVTGYSILYTDNETGKSVNLKLIPNKLQGLVFVPELYYHGIEAMAAYTYDYKALEDLMVADANGYADATKYPKGYLEPTLGEAMSITPNLVVKYHLNPSNVSESLLPVEEMSFLAEEKLYTKGAGIVMPEILDRKVVDGVLSVSARLSEGMIKDINEDNYVTVMALQVGTRGAKGDTLITSDYAALKAVTASNFVLSNAKEENTVCQHLHKTLQEAIDAQEADFNLPYDAKDGIDVAELIRTHADREVLNSNAPMHVRLDENAASGQIEQYGFAYEYALIGYTDGANKTSQSAHAQMNGSMLRAQVVGADGKQLAWGAEQSRSTIGRMPIVRVLLKDVISGEYVAVGYAKFEIVGEEVKDGILHEVTYDFTEVYTSNCGNGYTFQLDWNEVETGIFTALDMSKEEFEGQFELDGFVASPVTPANQYNKVDAEATKLTDPVGEVVRTTADIQGSQTQVLEWTISNNEAYELFALSNPKNTSVAAIVRFVRHNANNTESYVYVTFKWTPEAININPTGAIDNKFASLWFEHNSAAKGDQEVHFNVRVPESNTETSTACTFQNDLFSVFEGRVVKIVGDNEKLYTSYTDATLTEREFNLVTPTVTKITGMSGKTYLLEVNSLGTELLATELDAKGNKTTNVGVVVRLNNDQTPNPTQAILVYQENDIAKDVLNYADHTALGDAQTLTARVEYTATNACNREINLKNGTFDVKFLRPLSIYPKENDGLLDAVDGGDVIKVADILEISDWRYPNSNKIGLFTQATNYYFNYYGVTSIDIPEEKVTLADGRLLKEVYEDVVIEYVAPTTIAYNDLGTFTWKNGGRVLSEDIVINLPVVLNYKWGTMRVEIPVTVHQTVGQ